MPNKTSNSNAFLLDEAPNEALALIASERDVTKRLEEQRKYILALQEEVASLKVAVRGLKKQIREKDERIKRIEGRGRENENNQALEVPQSGGKVCTAQPHPTCTPPPSNNMVAGARFTDVEVWKFFFKFAGFNRFTIVSDEWHDANPTAANQIFGFKTWAEAKAAVKSKFPTMAQTPPHIYKLISTGNGDALDLDLRECSRFEQLMAVRLMDRTGLTVKRAALLYNKNSRTVTRWKSLWGQHWGLSPSGADDEANAGETGVEQGEHSVGERLPTRKIQPRQMINPAKRTKPAAPEELATDSIVLPAQVAAAPITGAIPTPVQVPLLATTVSRTDPPTDKQSAPSGDMWYLRNFGHSTL